MSQHCSCHQPGYPTLALSLDLTLKAGDIVVTGCQVLPLSVDTSTPATTPPPLSVAVPETVTVLPLAMVELAAGEVILDVGGVLSVAAVAATKPDSRVVGWTPI